MTTNTRPSHLIQRWYCSDCGCEHEGSVLGGPVTPLALDESLYEDDLDHEGHWFELWGED